MWDRLKDIAFKFFGRTLEPYVKYFDSIKPDLLRSGLGLSLTEYVYAMVFACMLVFIIEFPLLVVISSFLLRNALLAFLFSLTASIFIMLAIFLAFYSYPAIIATRRKKAIEAALPFATTYMATVASSGAPPPSMFKVLAGFPEYGDVAVEAGKIHRDIEAFGMDVLSAMRKTADRTPSPELKELLWGLDAVIATGGDVAGYLHEKAKGFMAEHRRRLESFSRTLSLLIEIYLTVILVGSIFFVIMTALMSIFGGGALNLMLSFVQFLIIFIVLPGVSLGFIVLLKTITP